MIKRPNFLNRRLTKKKRIQIQICVNVLQNGWLTVGLLNVTLLDAGDKVSLQALDRLKLGLIVKSDAELDTPTPLVAEDKVPPQVLEEQHLELVVKSPKEVKTPTPPPVAGGIVSPQVLEDLNFGSAVKSQQDLSPLVAGCKVSTQVPEELKFGPVVKSKQDLSPLSPLAAGCKVSTQAPEEKNYGILVKSPNELSPLVTGNVAKGVPQKSLKHGTKCDNFSRGEGSSSNYVAFEIRKFEEMSQNESVNLMPKSARLKVNPKRVQLLQLVGNHWIILLKCNAIYPQQKKIQER